MVAGRSAHEEAMVFARRLTGDALAVLDAAEPVAAILHGSLAAGDFIPGRSDVDLLLVVEHELTDAQIAAMLEVARRATARSLDLHVVTRAAAASPTASPPMELYVGAHGRSLAGRNPRDVIGPIPDEWVTRYGYQILERWEGLVDDEPNAELVVLTACRIWRLAATGAIVSKSSAARWALGRAPCLSAIPAARRRRAG